MSNYKAENSDIEKLLPVDSNKLLWFFNTYNLLSTGIQIMTHYSYAGLDNRVSPA